MPLLRLHNNESGLTVCTFRFDPMLVDAMKANGMKFDPDGKRTGCPKSWWTDSASVAEKLRLVAGEGDARQIHAELTRARREALVSSFAADSSAAFPCPKDLSYLPYQRAGIQYALGREGTLFGDEPGLGKEINVTTPVLVEGGWKLAGEVRPGDVMYSVDGKPTECLAVYPQGEKPMFLVEFVDGASCEVGREHLWSVMDNNAFARGRGWSVKSTEQLIAAGLSFGARKAPRWRIPVVAPVFRMEAYQPIPAYLLGVLIGDGSLTNAGVTFVPGDEEVPAEVAKVIGAGFEVRRNADYGASTRYSVAGTLGHHVNSYAGYLTGIGLRLTAEHKFIPDAYMLGSIEQRKSLLAGLLDTDGSAMGSRTRFATTSARLADQVVELVQSLGGLAGKSKTPGRLRNRDGRISQELDCWQLTIRTEFNPFRAPSKAAKWRKSDKLCRKIKSITPSRVAEAVCFTVDHPSHLYVIKDHIVTHNTVEAIGVLNTLVNIIRALVVCPASLKTNWLRELKKWLVYKDLTVGVAAGGYLPDTNIVVINYDIIGRHKEELLGIKWDAIILDEAHLLKNPRTLRARAICGFRSAKDKKVEEPALTAPKRLALTGTPILNRPAELFTTLNWLSPSEWPSRGAFGRRYCAGGTSFFDGASNLQELQVRLRGSVMIRRLKKDVLTDLPPKMRQVIEFDDPDNADKIEAERSAAQRYEMGLAMLKAAAELAKASDNPEEYKDAILALRSGVSAAFDELAKLRYDTAMSKVPFVIGHLKQLAADMPDEKFVVFAHHHDVIDAIYGAFPWEAVKLTGDMKTEDRQKSVDRFQTDKSVRVFVGSMMAAGVGLTLTASSHVVFAELDWVPATISQAEDRTHRVGQKNTVLVQHLVLAGSLDAVISRRIIDKQAVIDQALDQRVDQPDIVLPTVSVEAYEEVKIEEIDKAAVTFEPERIKTTFEQLHALPTPANPVDQIIVSRLKELAVLTARQAALAEKVIRRNTK